MPKSLLFNMLKEKHILGMKMSLMLLSNKLEEPNINKDEII